MCHLFILALSRWNLTAGIFSRRKVRTLIFSRAAASRSVKRIGSLIPSIPQRAMMSGVLRLASIRHLPAQ